MALLCVDAHFSWVGKNLCFIPSSIPKTDRLGRLTPPFCTSPGRSVCASAGGERQTHLGGARRLRLQHSALFFLWSFPHQPLNAAALVAALSVAS
jgi:hypothetical protein